MRYLTVLFITAALAGIASADILDTYVVSSPVPETKDLLYDAYGYGDYIPAGTLVKNELHLEVDDDWLSAVLIVWPDDPGTIYQFDADTYPIIMFPSAPDPVYPTKAYDTWVSDGLGGPPATGAAVDFYDRQEPTPVKYASVVFTEDEIALTFYTSATEIGDLLLAQVTLSVEAQGRWQFRATASPEGGPLVEIIEANRGGGGMYGDIVDGEMIIVPEPATLGLLAIGGLGILIRRKR